MGKYTDPYFAYPEFFFLPQNVVLNSGGVTMDMSVLRKATAATVVETVAIGVMKKTAV